MTLAEFKETLDILSSWTPPEHTYYSIGYSPEGKGIVIISFCVREQEIDGPTLELEVERPPDRAGLEALSKTVAMALSRGIRFQARRNRDDV